MNHPTTERGCTTTHHLDLQTFIDQEIPKEDFLIKSSSSPTQRPLLFHRPFENRKSAGPEKVRAWVLPVVGDPSEGHVERVLAEGSQAQQHLCVVADAAGRVALVLDLAANKQA